MKNRTAVKQRERRIKTSNWTHEDMEDEDDFLGTKLPKDLSDDWEEEE
ncbi:MAG: hypothetical protein KGK03_03205 [Candidatus Omnitrophica bacterium]|nr:hypothetical protein [Candidatus Omnitrophota bacterium]